MLVSDAEVKCGVESLIRNSPKGEFSAAPRKSREPDFE